MRACVCACMSVSVCVLACACVRVCMCVGGGGRSLARMHTHMCMCVAAMERKKFWSYAVNHRPNHRPRSMALRVPVDQEPQAPTARTDQITGISFCFLGYLTSNWHETPTKLMVVVVAFFLACEYLGRMFDDSFPSLPGFFFFLLCCCCFVVF